MHIPPALVDATAEASNDSSHVGFHFIRSIKKGVCLRDRYHVQTEQISLEIFHFQVSVEHCKHVKYSQTYFYKTNEQLF